MAETQRTAHLQVHVGGHLLAGTDAALWIQLVGERRRTQWFRLSPEGGEFTRASTFEFLLRFTPALDPGEVRAVQVQLGRGGALEGMYLDAVTVDGRRFPLSTWLAMDEPPYRLDASSWTDEQTRAYDVNIKTTQGFLAGTNAPVFVQLIGTKATTPWVHLHDPERSSFQSDSLDHFRFWAEDVGGLVGVRLRHDNTGVAPGWHVSFVEVDGRRLDFDRWFALDEHDGRIEDFRRLRPHLKPRHPLRLSLTTFADLVERADAAFNDDILHANRMFAPFGVTLERADPSFDVVLGQESWLLFQARHPSRETLTETLADLRASRSPRSHQRVLPVYYVGGLERVEGIYPDLSAPPHGVFLSLAERRPGALAYELARFLGLPNTTGTDALTGPVDTLRHRSNATDVFEGDPRNLMSHSAEPLALQSFTDGQFQNMVLNLLRYVG